MTFKLPFDNKKPVIIAIIILIALFTSYKAFSTELQVGPTYTGEFNGGIALVLSERVLDNKIDFGFSLFSEQTFNGQTTSNNGNVFVAFVATKPDKFWKFLPTEVSLGAVHWVKTDDRLIGSKQGYQLGIKYRFGQFSVGILHESNAGIVRPNRGQDSLMFGWRF